MCLSATPPSDSGNTRHRQRASWKFVRTSTAGPAATEMTSTTTPVLLLAWLLVVTSFCDVTAMRYTQHGGPMSANRRLR